MAKVEVNELDENAIKIDLTETEATILMQVLGRFNPEGIGILSSLYEELVDCGLEAYDNLHILNQTEAVLHLVVSKVDNSEEEA